MRLLKKMLLALFAAFLTLVLYDSFLPPISTLMMARVVTWQPISRRYVPLNHISPTLVHAVIAAEDGKFCLHHGVDWDSLHEVARDMADEDGEAPRGASTITMQTTKNLFLWTGHSYIRKALEIPLALGFDGLWGKRRMLEDYLNIAEFGRGIFGAEAAAQYYFHKPARALDAHESALLAATLPSPKRRNPARPSAYVARYAATIQARAAQGVDTSCIAR